jgi:Trk K+ transport system NAD-binding subunit
MITWSHHLYRWCEPVLGLFERRDPFREADEAPPAQPFDYVIFGLGRYGTRIGEALRARGFRVLGVDFDPEALADWRARGLDARFGDATDPEFTAHLPLDRTRAVIAAVSRERGPLTEANPQLALLHGLQSAGYRGRIVLSVNRAEDAADLRAKGASLVLTPFDDAAEFAVELLLEPDQTGSGASALS